MLALTEIHISIYGFLFNIISIDMILIIIAVLMYFLYTGRTMMYGQM